MVVMMGAWAQTAPTKQSNGTWQFTMPDANKLLEVEYEPCTLTVNPGANGTVAITSPTTGVIDNGDGTYNVMPGTEVTVTATADEHYLFEYWANENNEVIGTVSTKTFTVTGDTTLTAKFALKTFMLTLQSNYDNMGTVAASATSGLADQCCGSYKIDTGTVVTLTVTANDHYHFVNWTDKYSTAIGTSAQMQFTITKDTNITGNFAIDTCVVSFGPLATTQAAADANGSVDFDGNVPSGVVQKVEDNYLVPGTYKVPYNTTLNFVASPALYYHVTGWSGATQNPTDSSKATLTVIEDKTVSATFAIDTVRLDSIPLSWTVKINNVNAPLTGYGNSHPDSGYVRIPIDADVVVTPQPEAQAVRVRKLELIDKTPPATGHALALAVVGEIVGSDGLAYDVADKNNLPTGVTAVAMVAYKDGSNGLAIQLNASPLSMDWSSASSNTGYPAVSGGVASWRLPSMDDWQNMFVGCAKGGDSDKANYMDPIAGFKEKINAAGIEFDSYTFWSSTSAASPNYWTVEVNLYETNAWASFSQTPGYYTPNVLGCLAF